MTGPAEILRFWFEETPPARWFAPDAAFDRALAQRFGALVESAGSGALDDWAESAEGALALVLLLDQLPRNIHRGTARAYAFDARARAVARRAIGRGFDRLLPRRQRMFLYLPFEHSEGLGDQHLVVHLMAGLGSEQALDWALRHWRIIARFGRFPHRNAALGRMSSAAEQAFLERPGAGF